MGILKWIAVLLWFLGNLHIPSPDEFFYCIQINPEQEPLK